MFYTKVILSEEELARIETLRNAAIKLVVDKIDALNTQAESTGNSSQTLQRFFIRQIGECRDENVSIIPDFIANCGMARVFAYLMQESIDLDEVKTFIKNLIKPKNHWMDFFTKNLQLFQFAHDIHSVVTKYRFRISGTCINSLYGAEKEKYV